MNDDERRGFEQTIQVNRYDEVARRIYADWLSEQGLDDEATVQYSWTIEKQQAEDWLRGFACRCGDTCINYDEVTDLRRTSGPIEEKWVSITFEDVIQAGHDFIDNGDFFYQEGLETARDLMDKETTDLYWQHWSTYTGRSLPATYRGMAPFSCSC